MMTNLKILKSHLSMLGLYKLSTIDFIFKRKYLNIDQFKSSFQMIFFDF